MSGKRGQTATVLAPFEQMTGKSYPSGRFIPFHLIASDWTMGLARAKYRHLPTRRPKNPLRSPFKSRSPSCAEPPNY